MASKPLVETDNLYVHFALNTGFLSGKKQIVQAVHNVSLEILPGGAFGLVGESGCGKSTTGRAILRLLEPTSGAVRFDGKTTFDSRTKTKLSGHEMLAVRRNMQMIFQDPYASLDPLMNVGAIVSEGIRKHRLATGAEIMDRAADILKRCGMESDSMRRYPHEFSGGQRQRIGIARALALRPKFIVADEPIAALDVSIQAQVLNLLVDLQEEFALTYLFISHDLGVVRRFCDTICVMYLGNIVEQGLTSHVYTSPLHPYTRALLSAIPTGKPSKKSERIVLGGEPPSPIHPPPGCRFHTRCPHTRDVCRQQIPALDTREDDHRVACHFWKEI